MADASFTIDIPVEGKPAVDAAAASVDALAVKLESASKAGEGVKLETLERGLHKLGGPLGEIGGKVVGLGSGFGKLSSQLGDAAPMLVAAMGITAVVVAMAALAAAAITAIAKIAEFAIGLADANRTVLLLSQGIARSIAGGTVLNDKVQSLTKTLPLTQEEISGMAKRLADSGLRGQALSDALDRTATAAARLKFGPDFEKEMLSLDQQSKVFHANIAALFGGLKTDALMEGLQKLVALFDENTESGKALKAIFESLFQPLVDWLAANTSKVERFFLQLEIWVMKAMLAIKPWGSTILTVIEVFAAGAAVIAGIFAVAVLVAVAAMTLFMAPIILVVAGIAYLVVKLIEAGKAIVSFFETLNLADMGKALIDGLVSGIKAGASAVFDAIKGVVTGAIDKGKALLGIHSPSAVFADIGMRTGEGMSQGVEAASGGVQDSMEKMISPPGSSNKPAPAAPAAASAKGGASLSGVVFNFYGVEGAQDAEARFSEILTRALEGDAAQLGAMAPG